MYKANTNIINNEVKKLYNNIFNFRFLYVKILSMNQIILKILMNNNSNKEMKI